MAEDLTTRTTALLSTCLMMTLPHVDEQTVRTMRGVAARMMREHADLRGHLDLLLPEPVRRTLLGESQTA
jgi:hypothetical protein